MDFEQKLCHLSLPAAASTETASHSLLFRACVFSLQLDSWLATLAVSSSFGVLSYFLHGDLIEED